MRQVEVKGQSQPTPFKRILFRGKQHIRAKHHPSLFVHRLISFILSGLLVSSIRVKRVRRSTSVRESHQGTSRVPIW